MTVMVVMMLKYMMSPRSGGGHPKSPSVLCITMPKHDKLVMTRKIMTRLIFGSGSKRNAVNAGL